MARRTQRRPLLDVMILPTYSSLRHHPPRSRNSCFVKGSMLTYSAVRQRPCHPSPYLRLPLRTGTKSTLYSRGKKSLDMFRVESSRRQTAPRPWPIISNQSARLRLYLRHPHRSSAPRHRYAVRHRLYLCPGELGSRTRGIPCRAFSATPRNWLGRRRFSHITRLWRLLLLEMITGVNSGRNNVRRKYKSSMTPAGWMVMMKTRMKRTSRR